MKKRADFLKQVAKALSKLDNGARADYLKLINGMHNRELLKTLLYAVMSMAFGTKIWVVITG